MVSPVDARRVFGGDPIGVCYFTPAKTSAILRRMIFSKKWPLVFTILFTILPLSISHQVFAADPVDLVRREIDEAVAQVKPSLVRIQVVATQYYQGREVKYEASGSGVIISKEGH